MAQASSAALLKHSSQCGVGTFSGQSPPPSSSASSSFNGAPCLIQKAGSRTSAPRRRQVARASGFDLWKVLGGRGLQTGEIGLKTEKGQAQLFKEGVKEKSTGSPKERLDDLEEEVDGFNKELGGLVGGFPGGEKGLRTFIQKYPPPKKERDYGEAFVGKPGLAKARPSRPPLLMPGMTVICKNPDSVYHMYSGIVQRVTDGRVGVIFEGGNWDKLVTFELRDLERTTSGPPGTNPKSKIVEKKEPPAQKVAAVKEEPKKEVTNSSEKEPATAAASKE
eukprot:TRINITY_DN18919_c0_g1_i1.p1 TRINITY_DN18919_c0_g1~~TRINITY_DN18919_c0_g1_i1.p1  ORF type:complete len:278 (-),score=46.34 TRINITY_DN18919_c0_g1_i1:96-929(-)